MAATRDDPQYYLEIDMSYGGSWTTVTGIVAWSYTRGRQEELGTMEPGRMTVVFDNNAGNWSKLNPAGAFPPFTVPRWLMRPCRLLCVYNGANYSLYYGYIQSWTPQEGVGPTDANMVIGCVDYLYALHLAEPVVSLPQQDEAARIGAVLDAVATQPGETLARSLDAGLENVLAANLTGTTTALQHIQEVLAGERGIFFQAADNTLTFHNRHHRFITASGYTSQATFGQANLGTGLYPGGTLKYTSATPKLEDRQLYNAITVTASGAGETGTASDGTSQGFYWKRRLAVSAPWMVAGQAQYLADWLLYVYKTEVYRIPALTVRPSVLAEWVQALGREIGDRLTVTISGPGALTFSRDAWIEGISASWDIGAGHVTTWQLSDATSQGPTPFRLSLSALNSGDVLIY